MSSNQLPFHHNAFTSNYNSSSLFNIYLVVMTAMFFFLVLSWYNFFLSLYYYIFKYNPNTTVKDKKKELQGKYIKENEIILRNAALVSFGYALFWSLVTILTYLFLDAHGYLQVSPETSKYFELHPLLRDEASRSIAK
jgi:hypothetical protein